jgi:hypothetical protein
MRDEQLPILIVTASLMSMALLAIAVASPI